MATPKKIINSLLGLPDWHVQGRFGYQLPLPEISCGVYIEDTGLSKGSYYVWATILPLFPPASHVNFTFSRRVYGGHRFEEDELTPEIASVCRREILEHVANGKSFAGLIAYINAMPSEERRSPYVLET